MPNIPPRTCSGPPPQSQARHEQISQESCMSCGAPYAPQAAFCLRCGAPRHGISAPTAPPQTWPGGGNPALAYASMPAPFEQVPPPAATGPSWFQGPGGQMCAFPFPSNATAYGMPPAWQNGMFDQPQWSARREEWQPWSARAPEHLQTHPSHGVINQDAMGAHSVVPGPYSSQTHAQSMPNRTQERSHKAVERLCKLKCGGCCCKSLSARPKCTCCSKLNALFGRISSRCIAEFSKPRWQFALVASVGMAAVGSLMAALLDDPPHLMAAGLAAVVGWLACYIYLLQRDFLRLASSAGTKSSTLVEPTLESDQSDAVVVETMRGSDLDVTGLARHLGSPFAANNCAVLTERGKGKTGKTMQAVLTSALVKEYLRCSDQLQKYQKKHGILPNAPACTPGFAEALRSGLNSGSTSNIMRVASPSRAAVRKSSPEHFTPSLASGFGGTPNFETRFPPLHEDSLQAANSRDDTETASPPVARTNPYAETQKIAYQGQDTSPVRAGVNPFGHHATSSWQVPSANSTEVPPPPGDVETCRTIYQTRTPYGQACSVQE